MPHIALTTFMKLFSQTTPKKMTEYGKYLIPGGYDFYWSLKTSAALLTVGGKPLSECEKVIQRISREPERANNLAGLKALGKWVKKEGGTFFEPPQSVCKSPKGHLAVKLEPQFGIENEKGRRLITLWNAKSPNMSQAVAGVGIFLMQKFLQKGDFSDCDSGILDLRRNLLFVASAVPANVGAMVASEFAWVDEFFEQSKEAPKTEVEIAAHTG